MVMNNNTEEFRRSILVARSMMCGEWSDSRFDRVYPLKFTLKLNKRLKSTLDCDHGEVLCA